MKRIEYSIKGPDGPFFPIGLFPDELAAKKWGWLTNWIKENQPYGFFRSVEATLAQVAAYLTKAGLVARDLDNLSIIGGRSSYDRDGILVYEEGFTLWQEEGQYYAGLANLGTRCGPGSLDEAVAFLKEAYNLKTSPQDS